jgi:class 3 adenylate cyclase
MAATRVERRHAADVVGYSSLMERDEAGTLARLKDHRREFIDPLIAEHRGREHVVQCRPLDVEGPAERGLGGARLVVEG